MSKRDIKYYSKLKQKKYRESEGLFLIEGINLIEECLKSAKYKKLLSKVFVRNDYPNTEFISSVSVSNPHIDIIYADSKEIKALSETVNSQGIIGVVQKSSHTINKLSEKMESNLLVLLESINDPGNLGTIIRTCYWYGVDKLFLSEDSVDVYNSKVLRSSQGALFHIDIDSNIDSVKIAGEFYKNNYNVILTDPNAGEYVSEIKFIKKDNYLIIFGNESGGISKSIIENQNYKRVKIKGYSGCESLNVAVSAGILLDRIRT